MLDKNAGCPRFCSLFFLFRFVSAILLQQVQFLGRFLSFSFSGFVGTFIQSIAISSLLVHTKHAHWEFRSKVISLLILWLYRLVNRKKRFFKKTDIFLVLHSLLCGFPQFLYRMHFGRIFDLQDDKNQKNRSTVATSNFQSVYFVSVWTSPRNFVMYGCGARCT